MSLLEPKRNTDLAVLFIRIAVGLIFIYAGWGKLTGIEGTANFFGNVGIPMAGAMAWLVGIVEFVGGLMILTGTKIELPALLLVIVMIVAIITTKLGQDNVFRAMRLDMALMLMSLALYFTGAGKYSVDAKLNDSNS